MNEWVRTRVGGCFGWGLVDVLGGYRVRNQHGEPARTKPARPNQGLQSQPALGAIYGRRPYLPPPEDRYLLETVATLGDSLAIVDQEMQNLSVDAAVKRAEAFMRFTWHWKTEGVLKTTYVLQVWEWSNDNWFLTSQKRTQGQRFPLVPEAALKPSPATAVEPVAPSAAPQ